MEGLSGATSSALSEWISSQTDVWEFLRFSLTEYFGLGLSEDDHMALLVRVEGAEKLSANTAQSEGLPEALFSEPRNGMHRPFVN